MKLYSTSLIVLILVVSAYFQPCSHPVNGLEMLATNDRAPLCPLAIQLCDFFDVLGVYNSTFTRQAINCANLVGCDVQFVEVKSVILEFRASFQTCPVAKLHS